MFQDNLVALNVAGFLDTHEWVLTSRLCKAQKKYIELFQWKKVRLRSTHAKICMFEMMWLVKNLHLKFLVLESADVDDRIWEWITSTHFNYLKIGHDTQLSPQALLQFIHTEKKIDCLQVPWPALVVGKLPLSVDECNGYKKLDCSQRNMHVHCAFAKQCRGCQRILCFFCSQALLRLCDECKEFYCQKCCHFRSCLVKSCSILTSARFECITCNQKRLCVRCLAPVCCDHQSPCECTLVRCLRCARVSTCAFCKKKLCLACRFPCQSCQQPACFKCLILGECRLCSRFF